MNIQELILGALTSILSAAIIVTVKMVKEYLITKGGVTAVRLIEIVAQNAVNAVEQMAKDKDIHGIEKFDLAKQKVQGELSKYNVYFTDSQINTFIEAAVKAMNDGWKGEQHGSSN